MVASWWPCCCGGVSPDCIHCTDDMGPAQFAFSVSGFANNGGCSDCPSLDGTYIVDYIGSCFWEADFSTACGTVTVTVHVQSGGVTVIFGIESTPSDFIIEFAKPLLSEFDCSGETLTGFSSGVVTSFPCDTLSLTASLVAV